MAKDTYLAVCVPCVDKPELLFSKALAAMHWVLGANDIPVAAMDSNGSMGAFQARNQIMEGIEKLEAEGVKIEWLLWLDVDMIFPPDLFLRLRAHDKDIVGATYVRRAWPYDLHGRGLTGKPQEVKTGLVEMAGLPTGCLLTRRSVFKHFKKPIWRCLPDESKGMTHGEDYYFCFEARQRGFKIWLDVDLSKEIGHIGQRVYTIEKDAYSGLPEDEPKVEIKAVANG